MNKKIFSIACLVLIIDQISKGLISAQLAIDESITLIKNFFYLTYTNNYGAAWSIFTNYSFIIIILSIIAILIVIRFMYIFTNNNRNTIAFGLIIGGTAGNLVDRIIFGYVRDFLNFYVFKYDYPIFNIADMAIVIGIILLIYAILKGEDRSANKSRKSKRSKNR